MTSSFNDDPLSLRNRQRRMLQQAATGKHDALSVHGVPLKTLAAGAVAVIFAVAAILWITGSLGARSGPVRARGGAAGLARGAGN